MKNINNSRRFWLPAISLCKSDVNLFKNTMLELFGKEVSICSCEGKFSVCKRYVNLFVKRAEQKADLAATANRGGECKPD